MSGVVVSDLHKRFGSQQVLSGLDLTVAEGSFTALLGPSGAGKTTLLRLIAGFDRPDRGRIDIGRRTVSAGHLHLRPEQRRIGYVPQEGSLFPHLTLAANITFGLPRGSRRKAAQTLTELVGLTGLERRYPHQLSGGQQQRAALARALAISPSLVLLDEPFASLDANLRADLRAEVHRILMTAGTTTLLVTHNQDEALSIADTIAVLRDRRIIQSGSPDQLYTNPVDHRLAAFIGDANLLEGQLQPAAPDGRQQRGRIVSTALGDLPARWHQGPPPGTRRVTALIRPEQITLAPATPHSPHPTGRVLQRDYHGHDTVLRVELSDRPTLQPVLVRTAADPAVGPGDSCALTVHGSALVWPADAGDGRGNQPGGSPQGHPRSTGIAGGEGYRRGPGQGPPGGDQRIRGGKR